MHGTRNIKTQKKAFYAITQYGSFTNTITFHDYYRHKSPSLRTVPIFPELQDKGRIPPRRPNTGKLR